LQRRDILRAEAAGKILRHRRLRPPQREADAARQRPQVDRPDPGAGRITGFVVQHHHDAA
jgi:hypothetical protein